MYMTEAEARLSGDRMNIGDRKGKDGWWMWIKYLKYSYENVLMKLVIVDSGHLNTNVHFKRE